MTKIPSGESSSRGRTISTAIALVAATLLVPGLVKVESRAGDGGVDPAIVRADYVEEWVKGKGCLAQGFDPDNPDHPAAFSYDPATGVATIRADILKYNPATGEYKRELAPTQPPPDAYYRANNGEMDTALMRYVPNALPGARVAPADPATELYIIRTCRELESQLPQWEPPSLPGTLPPPPPPRP